MEKKSHGGISVQMENLQHPLHLHMSYCWEMKLMIDSKQRNSCGGGVFLHDVCGRHAVRDCALPRRVWRQLLPQQGNSQGFLDLYEHVTWTSFGSKGSTLEVWRWRNASFVDAAVRGGKMLRNWQQL